MHTFRCRTAFVFLTLSSVLIPLFAADKIPLVGTTAPDYVLYVANLEDEGDLFAAQELQRYLEQLTGIRLEISDALRPPGSVISVGKAAAERLGAPVSQYSTHEEGFAKLVQPGRVILAGNSRRSTLYAVYDFLEDLGCRWFAPNFAFYGPTSGEWIPSRPSLECETGVFVEEPTFAYRGKRVEEGWSISPEHLRLIIDWIAKTKQNAFNMTIDYGGTGRIPYEKYRNALIPELKKRGLLTHIGGHNYSLFLPDSYFEDHPDWFGMNAAGERVPMLKGGVNFNTANPEAVAMFIRNCKEWLRAHPEIDLFSLVPEDSPVWDTSPESVKLGSIPTRHALFANQVLAELKEEFPNLKVTLPAYQALIRPPEEMAFEENATVGFAVIRRDNTKPIFDISSSKNLYYLNYLWQWLDSGASQGGIQLGGYYRRYAFRSLPLVNYGIIAADLRYATIAGLSGIGEYGEPGDWFTYELTHFVVARLSWNSSESVDTILEEYCRARFGAAATKMRDFFFLLNGLSAQMVRGFGDYTRLQSEIPFPELQVQQIFSEPSRVYMRHIELCRRILNEAGSANSDPVVSERIEKWSTLLQYLALELQAKMMSEVLSTVSPYGAVLGRIQNLHDQMQALLESNRDRGMFLLEDQRLQYTPQALPSEPDAGTGEGISNRRENRGRKGPAADQ